jgi:antitoxin component YwqK of YwqJK toxin-antitoxin module
MNRFLSQRCAGLERFLLLVVGGLLSSGIVWAQPAPATPSTGEPSEAASLEQRVKIEPYTGPPILLEEPKEIAPPTIVERKKLPEKFAGTEQVRVEREVALYSDNHIEADGSYREYYPTGQLFVEGQFQKGRKQGEWTYYHDNGQVNRKAAFKEGQPDGTWEIHRADGTLVAKRGFVAGRRNGEWISYDDKGEKPLREDHYLDGKPDGVWKLWFPNGNLKQEISFQNGVQHGLSTEWEEAGKKRAEVPFTEGKLDGTATYWTSDGRKLVREYKAGQLISERRE